MYHLACAGYSADQRPSANKPWYCHFCVTSKAKHTVFVQRRRPGAPQSTVRLGIRNLQEKGRLEAESMALFGGTGKENSTGAQLPSIKKYSLKLQHSVAATDRLEQARAKTVSTQIERK